MQIKPLFAPDITPDFLHTLAALSEVSLSVEEAREVFRRRLSTGVLSFIAVEDGRVVGTASLIVEQKFLHRGGKAAHIEDVAVHPDYQRRGIGKALILHATQIARERGCYKVVLDCHDHLAEFYEKCGFTRSSCQMRQNLT